SDRAGHRPGARGVSPHLQQRALDGPSLGAGMGGPGPVVRRRPALGDAGRRPDGVLEGVDPAHPGRAARSRERIGQANLLEPGRLLHSRAGLLNRPTLLHDMRTGEAHLTWGALGAGFVASAVVGTFVIRWMLDYLRRRTYAVFTIYRLLAAAAIVALWLARN